MDLTALNNGKRKRRNNHLDLQQHSNRRVITSPPPTSCVTLGQLGYQLPGFYLIKDNQAGNSIQTVYCDFALSTNDPSNSKNK